MERAKEYVTTVRLRDNQRDFWRSSKLRFSATIQEFTDFLILLGDGGLFFLELVDWLKKDRSNVERLKKLVRG